MKKIEDIRPYLKYYIGQQHRYRYVEQEPGHWMMWSELTPLRLTRLDDLSIDGIQLALRTLSSMTEEEMQGLIAALSPNDIEDRPTIEDYDIELFHNDGGLMVDDDVAIGAEYTCRCYVGQIAIGKNGSIHLFGEDGKIEHQVNYPQAFHYLLSKGFDLFGLIESGLAISSITVKDK